MLLSAEESAALLTLEREREGSPQCVVRFLDNTAQIVQSYEHANPKQKIFEDTESHGITSPELIPINAPNHSVPSIVDIAPDNIVQPSIPTSNASGVEVGIATTTPAQMCTSDLKAYHFQAVEGVPEDHCSAATSTSSQSLGSGYFFVAPAYFDVDLPIPKPEQAYLIRAYTQETGTWCEATDIHQHFTVTSLQALMKNKPFSAAAMALASRQRDATHKNPSDSTLKIYQYAVQSLLHYEPSQCGEATLSGGATFRFVRLVLRARLIASLTAVGLCVQSDEQRLEWLLSSSCGSVFLGFCTYWYVQEANLSPLYSISPDIWAAYLLQERTLVPTETWMDCEEGAMAKTPESHCNLATLLLARIINYLADMRRDNLNELWNDLQGWFNSRPPQFSPVLRTEPGRDNPFPVVLHAGSISICGNTFYHTGCMLLLRTGRVQSCADGDDLHNPVWHATELCGISTTTTSHACWINQVYPLCIAGQAFGDAIHDVDGGEHAAEKFALLKHLARIERDTGWPTAIRSAALRKLWGLD
ncbi:alkaline phosphatase family protein [Stagonosporopsis vannaccii]|nr:alkaline phosphatase family protein [Stagonosporopsis vannaccii]